MSSITASDPKIAPYSTSNTLSFAYPSARDRWPIILTQGIDDLHRATALLPDSPKCTEGKTLIASLAKLKYELQHNRPLTPLPDDGLPDIEAYNAELEGLSPLSWFDGPWLFVECYLYRRLQQLFTLSTHWKAYDIFHATKTTALRSSRRAIIELATHFKAITQSLSSSSFPSEEDREKAALLLFQEVSLISLWGNATDLSLLPDLSHSALQKLQGAAARQASAGNLLANDLPAAFEVLRGLQKAGKPRRVDIVLDNAGFELYVDLVLAAYLLVAGLADSVILRPKSMPWFVSDVVAADLYGLLNALADPAFFGDDVAEAEAADLRFLFEKLSVLHAEGQMILRPDAFWTSAHSFWRLPSQAPDLWGDLKDAALVVFKGDLNYRKLVGDVMWPPTTPFSEAIGPLNEGLRVLALRTCKGDVVVGLPEGRDEELRHTEGAAGQFDEEAKKDDKARRWAWCGKWAVVQFADGKGGE